MFFDIDIFIFTILCMIIVIVIVCSFIFSYMNFSDEIDDKIDEINGLNDKIII